MNKRSAWLPVILFLSIFMQGCLVDVTSIVAPDSTTTGKVVIVTVSGTLVDNNDGSPVGIVLQIPSGTQVLKAHYETSLGNSSDLTPDASITSGYIAEEGYHLYGGTGSSGQRGNRTVILEVWLAVPEGVIPGDYRIKAAVGVKANGVWTSQIPQVGGIPVTNFSLITGKYVSNPMTISAGSPDISAPSSITPVIKVNDTQFMIDMSAYDEAGQGDVASYRVYLSKYSFSDAAGRQLLNGSSSPSVSGDNTHINFSADIDGTGLFYFELSPGAQYLTPVYISGLVQHIIYYLAVTAVDISGNESAPVIVPGIIERGSISGRITNSIGQPIPWGTVGAEGADSGGSAMTNSSGDYTITNLIAGEYKIHACATGYACRFYDGINDFDSAKAVVVMPAADTPGINITLEDDGDGDGIADVSDNCPAINNPDQSDMNGNGIGDACDTDIDGDGIPNDVDNCPLVYNPDQADSTGFGLGDACTVRHCVSNSVELQYALNTAQFNGMNDVIQLVQGTYGISKNEGSHFYFNSGESYGLVITGGYTQGCVTHELNPANTILDGENIDQGQFSGGVLYLSSWSESPFVRVVVNGLSIRNGKANYHGGISAGVQKGNIEVTNNMIRRNASDTATVYAQSLMGNVVIANNLVATNTAVTGIGGIDAYVLQGRIDIINNTVTDNSVSSVSGAGGGLYLYLGSNTVLANIYNNIILGNRAAIGNDIYIGNWNGGTVTAFNNDFDPTKMVGTFTNEGGNINEDPWFVDAANGDYRLSECIGGFDPCLQSPAIDAGNNSAPNLPLIDIEGNNRIIGISVDMGAHEYKDSIVPTPSTKIGVFDHGTWYLDSNQSWAWEGVPADTLGIFGVGLTNAIPVVGDWIGNGTSKIGVFMDGTWYLDMNRNWQWDGETDKMGIFGVGLTGAVPVVGDWTGNGITKIGVFIDGAWYLDMNNNGQWDGELTDKLGTFGIGLSGAMPVVGDWTGNGITKIGVYIDGSWYLDMNNNWQWDGESTDKVGIFGVGLTGAVPVVGDWNADGTTEIGIYQDGLWYLDKNRSWAWDGEPTDQFGVFGVGLTGVVPVPGKW